MTGRAAYLVLGLSLCVGLGLLARHHRQHGAGSRHLGLPCPAPEPIFNDHTEASVRVADDASASVALADFFGAGAEGVPVGVTFSGGGWKALAQHMGVARALADLGLSLAALGPRDGGGRAANGTTTAARVLAANSGGTWFLTLLGFSPRFAAAVQTPTSPTSPTVGAAYADFMTAYASLIDKPSGRGAMENEAADEALWRKAQADEMIGAVLDALPTLKLAKRLRKSWQAFVEAMLDAYEPGVADRIVGEPTNAALRGASLAFQLTVASSSYLVDRAGKPVTSCIHFDAPARSATSARAPVPAFYSTSRSQPWVPLAGDGRGATVSLNRVWRAMTPFAQALPDAPMRLGLVAAASSAAAGLVGDKDMIEQALAGRSCRLHHTAKAVVSHAWPILSLEAQAPCSDGSLHECRFPHVRLMDGVYYENTAIVAALVELQRRAGPDHGAELRLFASVANSCEPAKVAEGVAGCTTNNGYNQIEMLFANLPVAPTGERYPSEAGAAYRVGGLGGPLEGTLAYDARVFAERLPADWRAHGGSAFRTLTLNATTVDNPASGVRAGSRVTLLVLFGNVPPSCPVAQPPGVDDETVAACAALADGVCAFVRGMGAASSIGSYVEGATAR